jgi:hypothetical protein
MEKRMARMVEGAVAVLRAGGYWRKALENGWHGEKFKTRLRDAAGRAVKGYGFKCHDVMVEAGMLARRECAPSSVWPQEWVLAQEVVTNG